jgi:hypothetical protein
MTSATTKTVSLEKAHQANRRWVTTLMNEVSSPVLSSRSGISSTAKP